MSFRKRQIEKKSNFPKVFFGFLVILIIVFGYMYQSYNSFKKSEIITADKEIIIKSGQTFSNLGKQIPELENIFYKIYLRFNTPDFELGEGKYKLEKGENISEIFESLQKPILDEMNITILEGWNIYDIDLKLTKKGLIEKGDFIAYVTSPEKIQALSEFFPFLKNENLESLEGFLYPETYKINPEEFAINILVIAELEQFENRVYNKLFKDKIDNKTIYDVVNLASIVEREEKIAKNKKKVAGILKKRLNNDWMIGADASVCYPFKITSAECTQNFIDKNVFKKNEYNTRSMKGLPKTPIGNPSYETIEATLNDEKSPYWYYLHNMNNGQIYYAKDEAEHQYNIRNFMRK